MGDFGPPAPPPVDGDVNSLSTSEDVTVLVTGFGPFRNNPLNPSYLIASSLPSSIPFPANSRGAKPSTDQFPSSTPRPPSPRNIRIHTHPSALRVSYSTVRNAVPAILDSFAQNHDGKRPDITVHIGLAAAKPYYCVETVAHRDGYCVADVDGRVGFQDGERRWKAHSLPDILRPGPAVDTEPNYDDDSSSSRPMNPTTLITAAVRAATEATTGSSAAESSSSAEVATSAETSTTQPIDPYPPDLKFLERWKTFAPSSADVRLSDQAGRYLCEFIFYTSLAQALEEGRPGSVVFLHVPNWLEDEQLEMGRDVAIALIQTLVSCWVDGR